MERYPHPWFANGKIKKNQMICQKPQRINSDTVQMALLKVRSVGCRARLPEFNPQLNHFRKVNYLPFCALICPISKVRLMLMPISQHYCYQQPMLQFTAAEIFTVHQIPMCSPEFHRPSAIRHVVISDQCGVRSLSLLGQII